MQFFFLLLFNLFLGAVLYLVISLKLERSATEYRSRKLRKEMDEMISEFNATAERNISLLERKISLMRILLERAGDVRSLDLIAAEEELDREQDASVPTPERDAGPWPVAPREAKRRAPSHAPDEENNAASPIKKGLLLFIEKITTMLQTGPAGGRAGEYAAGMHGEAVDGVYPDPGADRRRLIEKDLSDVAPAEDASCIEQGPALTEDELREIIESSADRFSLIAVLSERGCAIEEISRYSGLPVGEVRLVLNLNSSR